METKRVLVRDNAYFDGVKKWEPGTILEVPKSFGMRAKRDEDGKVIKVKGESVMVPSDNFPVVEVGKALPIPTTDAAPFPDNHTGLDPALKGMSPRAIDPNKLPAGEGLAEGQVREVKPDPTAPTVAPAPSPEAAAAAAKG